MKERFQRGTKSVAKKKRWFSTEPLCFPLLRLTWFFFVCSYLKVQKVKIIIDFDSTTSSDLAVTTGVFSSVQHASFEVQSGF